MGRKRVNAGKAGGNSFFARQRGCKAGTCLAVMGLLLLGSYGLKSPAQAQSVSEHALIPLRFFNDPPTEILDKAATNEFWGVDLFGSVKSAAGSYIITPDGSIYSLAGFFIDQDWERMIYFDYTESRIKAFGGHGTGPFGFQLPRSVTAYAPQNEQYYSNYYYIYVVDADNTRILTLTYDWRPQSRSLLPTGQIGPDHLYRPVDLDLNDGSDFWVQTNDYLWILDGDRVIKRFTTEGQIQSAYGLYGCAGSEGQFCRATAIVCGRDAFLSSPNDRFANTNDIYVADPGNQRIAWLCKSPVSEMVYWIGQVATGPAVVDLETDIFGHVWAIDEMSGMITKYTYDLFPLCTFGGPGSGIDYLLYPTSIANLGGYLGLGNMFVAEHWTDSTGCRAFSIGTDVVDFAVASTPDNYWHYVQYVLVDPSFVTIKISTTGGAPVRTLFNSAEFSGYCSHVWDGANDAGQQAATGDYIVDVYDTSSYIGVISGGPVNVVHKQSVVHHVYNPMADYVPGDANNDGSINVADVIYIINYIFRGGPPPQSQLCVGDVNTDGSVSIADAVCLINFVFKSGSPPLDGCQFR